MMSGVFDWPGVGCRITEVFESNVEIDDTPAKQLLIKKQTVASTLEFSQLLSKQNQMNPDICSGLPVHTTF